MITGSLKSSRVTHAPMSGHLDKCGWQLEAKISVLVFSPMASALGFSSDPLCVLCGSEVNIRDFVFSSFRDRINPVSSIEYLYPVESPSYSTGAASSI